MSILPKLSFILLACYLLLSSIGCKGEIAGTPEPGPAWVTFTASTSPLPDNIVNQVYADRSNRIWFATNRGAAYYKDKSWGIFRDSLKFIIYNNSTPIAAYIVNSITQGKDRSMWFGLNGGGVERFNEFSQNGNIWTRYKSPTLISDYVASLAPDISNATLNGEMWFVTGGGVNRLIENSTNGGQWIDYQSPPFPSTQNTVAVISPYDYSVWIGSSSNGLEHITYDPIPISLSNVPIPAGYVGKVTGIAFDGNNNVWMSKDVGISYVNLISGLWTHFSTSSTGGKLPPGEIHTVESDLGINRWFGTDSGLVHLVDTTWTRFSTANSPLPNDTVTSLKYDIHGNLWIGTRRGVAAYKPGGTQF